MRHSPRIVGQRQFWIGLRIVIITQNESKKHSLQALANMIRRCLNQVSQLLPVNSYSAQSALVSMPFWAPSPLPFAGLP